jgi:hypothetical protein
MLREGMEHLLVVRQAVHIAVGFEQPVMDDSRKDRPGERGMPAEASQRGKGVLCHGYPFYANDLVEGDHLQLGKGCLVHVWAEKDKHAAQGETLEVQPFLQGKSDCIHGLRLKGSPGSCA